MIQNKYISHKTINQLPRLLAEASIDLTYRCNNNCRHCWLYEPMDSKTKKEELSFDEITGIINQARNLGCSKWMVSGGEPMVREDFKEIVDHISNKAKSYIVNTNGTLITQKIAKLLKNKGHTMVALYGATADVHDHITRNPGSFQATMKGINYLKEEKAIFSLQIIPMKDNYHQFNNMLELARSLSPLYRVGAPWLYLSACGDEDRNKEIKAQRLPANIVVDLDKPAIGFKGCLLQPEKETNDQRLDETNALATCVNSRREVHIDPYGKMSFCCFVKDPKFRYDLKKGKLQKGWEEFIPSLAKSISLKKEYFDNCQRCDIKNECRWCPTYSYLENRRHEAKVDYLCKVARENKIYKEKWEKENVCYYEIAGIPLRIESELPIKKNTFSKKLDAFKLKEPQSNPIIIRHSFTLPRLEDFRLEQEVYRQPPWAIYRNKTGWVYLCIGPNEDNSKVYHAAVCNKDYSQISIFHQSDKFFQKGNQACLTFPPTDQILISQIAAQRKGCYFHAAGVNLKGKGLLFVGHSDAGKSTTVELLRDKANILCDDRIIVRKINGELKACGTWSHGDVSDVSSECASLKSILFLNQAKENHLKPLNNKKEAVKMLLECTIKSYADNEWWEKNLNLIEQIVDEIPCYIFSFKKDKSILESLKSL